MIALVFTRPLIWIIRMLLFVPNSILRHIIIHILVVRPIHSVFRGGARLGLGLLAHFQLDAHIVSLVCLGAIAQLH